jgi:hypothetical protein
VWQPEEGSFMKNPRNKDKQHFSPTDAAAEGSNTGTTRNAMKEKVAADKTDSRHRARKSAAARGANI